MTVIKPGLPALLISTVLATQATGQIANLADFGLAFNDDPAADTSDTDLTFETRIALDNGLTFGADVDVDDVGGAEESNDKPANSDFIIADLLFASEVNNGANARRPDGFAAGGCAQFGADGRLGAHVPFSLNRLGFRISLSLIGASKCG
jgi:hypothetical protein